MSVIRHTSFFSSMLYEYKLRQLIQLETIFKILFKCIAYGVSVYFCVGKSFLSLKNNNLLKHVVAYYYFLDI